MNFGRFGTNVQRRCEFLPRRFSVSVLLFASLQWGCSTLPEVRPNTIVPTTPKAAYFALQGRLSVRVGDRLDAGNIRWSRKPDEECIALFTPFGSQLAEVIKRTDGNGSVTMRKDNETITAESIEALTSGVFGVGLDLDAIAAWTQGVGLAEGVSTERMFANGMIWQVTAERFSMRGPHRVAGRLSAVSGDTVVRVVIDEWQAQ